MPKLNLGRVVGRDGGFGNIDTVYLNDGGDPRVIVEASGVDSAKDFRFTFANLVRDAATADEVEQIAAGEIVQSSNVITVGVMSSIWSKIKAAFAPKAHTHSGADIDDGTITKAKLEKTLGDSLSRVARSVPVSASNTTQRFVPAPAVAGYRPTSCLFDGTWEGLPALSGPMGNNGGFGARIIADSGGKFSVEGSVVFVYERV